MDVTTIAVDKKTRDRLSKYKEAEGRETFDRLLNRLMDEDESGED